MRYRARSSNIIIISVHCNLSKGRIAAYLPVVVTKLYNELVCLSTGDLDPILYKVSWASTSVPPNGISISSSVFAQFKRVPNTHTPRYVRRM